jgi:hypothetical protein
VYLLMSLNIEERASCERARLRFSVSGRLESGRPGNSDPHHLQREGTSSRVRVFQNAPTLQRRMNMEMRTMGKIMRILLRPIFSMAYGSDVQHLAVGMICFEVVITCKDDSPMNDAFANLKHCKLEVWHLN